MIYFTADTHFCHHNIIASCGRPFDNVKEMNETLITNWNALVSGRDEVYILGDFLYKGEALDANRILKRLRGKKYMIRGNHDKFLDAPDFDLSLFEWVKDYHVLDYKDARFVLFHYPIAEWQFYHRRSVHLYGHVHNSSPELFASEPRAMNVGADVNYFYPVSAEDAYGRLAIAVR